jgi:hypothetical protein
MPSPDQTRGAGGTQPRPINAPSAPSGAVVSPGVTGGTFVGHLVVVFGLAGEPVGVFVYAVGTTPAKGNPPIAWMTNQTADPYGNPVEAGVGSADSGGDRNWLGGSILNFLPFSAFGPGQISAAPGELLISSGNKSSGFDSQAEIFLQDEDVSGTPNGQIILTAGGIKLGSSASGNIPWPAPSVTGADGIAIVNALAQAGIFT